MPVWGIFNGKAVPTTRTDISVLIHSPYGDFEWLCDNPAQSRIMAAWFDVGRPESVALARQWLCRWAKVYERVYAISVIDFDPQTDATVLRCGFILPYFHHIPYWMRPLEERRLVLHYTLSDLKVKGTHEVLQLRQLIERLGYSLTIYSWFPRPSGIPSSVEWRSQLDLAGVFELHSRARVFVAASQWDTWSRATLYALKFHTPIVIIDRGATLPLWLKECIDGDPLDYGICNTVEEAGMVMERLLSSDEEWYEAVDRWQRVMAAHPLLFDEYAIAEYIGEQLHPLPDDFMPVHHFLYVTKECFPPDLLNCGEPSVVFR